MEKLRVLEMKYQQAKQERMKLERKCKIREAQEIQGSVLHSRTLENELKIIERQKESAAARNEKILTDAVIKLNEFNENISRNSLKKSSERLLTSKQQFYEIVIAEYPDWVDALKDPEGFQAQKIQENLGKLKSIQAVRQEQHKKHLESQLEILRTNEEYITELYQEKELSRLRLQSEQDFRAKIEQERANLRSQLESRREEDLERHRELLNGIQNEVWAGGQRIGTPNAHIPNVIHLHGRSHDEKLSQEEEKNRYLPGFQNFQNFGVESDGFTGKGNEVGKPRRQFEIKRESDVVIRTPQKIEVERNEKKKNERADERWEEDEDLAGFKVVKKPKDEEFSREPEMAKKKKEENRRGPEVANKKKEEFKREPEVVNKKKEEFKREPEVIKNLDRRDEDYIRDSEKIAKKSDSSKPEFVEKKDEAYYQPREVLNSSKISDPKPSPKIEAKDPYKPKPFAPPEPFIATPPPILLVNTTEKIIEASDDDDNPIPIIKISSNPGALVPKPTSEPIKISSSKFSQGSQDVDFDSFNFIDLPDNSSGNSRKPSDSTSKKAAAKQTPEVVQDFDKNPADPKPAVKLPQPNPAFPLNPGSKKSVEIIASSPKVLKAPEGVLKPSLAVWTPELEADGEFEISVVKTKDNLLGKSPDFDVDASIEDSSQLDNAYLSGIIQRSKETDSKASSKIDSRPTSTKAEPRKEAPRALTIEAASLKSSDIQRNDASPKALSPTSMTSASVFGEIPRLVAENKVLNLIAAEERRDIIEKLIGIARENLARAGRKLARAKEALNLQKVEKLYENYLMRPNIFNPNNNEDLVGLILSLGRTIPEPFLPIDLAKAKTPFSEKMVSDKMKPVYFNTFIMIKNFFAEGILQGWIEEDYAEIMFTETLLNFLTSKSQYQRCRQNLSKMLKAGFSRPPTAIKDSSFDNSRVVTPDRVYSRFTSVKAPVNSMNLNRGSEIDKFQEVFEEDI